MTFIIHKQRECQFNKYLTDYLFREDRSGCALQLRERENSYYYLEWDTDGAYLPTDYKILTGTKLKEILEIIMDFLKKAKKKK